MSISAPACVAPSSSSVTVSLNSEASQLFTTSIPRSRRRVVLHIHTHDALSTVTCTTAAIGWPTKIPKLRRQSCWRLTRLSSVWLGAISMVSTTRTTVT